MSLSVIVPACNEAGYIGACLTAVLDSTDIAGLDVVVAANGCTDDTAARARAFQERFAQRGWRLEVLELPALGKPGALDAADAAARHDMRAYLDADVCISPRLLSQLVAALSVPQPLYASGRPHVTAHSPISRAYARFWTRLPFVADGVPGFGIFAVNAQGRARWAQFPKIISDDTFVRLLFAPHERVMVAASYDWPLIEGFRRLVRVRRRQDDGVRELARLYPALMENDAKDSPTGPWLLKQAFRDPVAFATYAAVTLAVKSGIGRQEGWARGR
ncbi:MAG: glycosyl transferase [Rhodobacterales bacterium]|nr:MAG: glycosyl transferase [Rhodobacterales bacterium]